VKGTGGFELSPGLTNGIYTTGPQVLAGFGTVKGSSTVGLTIGLAPGTVTGTASTSTALTSTGNNFGGYAFANGSSSAPLVNHSVVSPGYTSTGSALFNASNSGFYQPSNPQYGTIVVGTTTGGVATVAFNTHPAGTATATGALTLGGGSSTATNLGAGGTYDWKLDLSNASAGATPTPGTATVSPGLTSGAPAAGAAWDELILDNLTVNSTIGASTTSGTSTNAFTIEGTDFSSSGANTFSNTSNYSWVIARVNQAYSAGTSQQFLASLSLNTAGLPAAASGYQYFLSAQADPSAADTDLVVNYAPAPEPTGLLLLGLGAAPLLRRRRNASPGRQIA
jgi:MYXO-CTERM domain-containing protein